MRAADRIRIGQKKRLWNIMYSAERTEGKGQAIRALAHAILRWGWPQGQWPGKSIIVAEGAVIEIERLFAAMNCKATA